ncbi:MAG TPA: hypothetical protein VF510_05805 [Ktedonobacterales bacterium]
MQVVSTARECLSAVYSCENSRFEVNVEADDCTPLVPVAAVASSFAWPVAAAKRSIV